MASVLDVSLLGFFQPIFILLIVFALVYGILEKTEMFGKGKSILHLIIAICIALSTVVVKAVSGVLGTIFPWFVLLFTVVLFVFMIYGFLGVDSKKVFGLIGYTPLLLIMLAIVGGVLLITFQDKLSPYNPSETTTVSNVTTVTNGTTVQTPTSETLKTLTNPRLLGALLLLGLTALSAKLIVDKVRGEP